MAIVLRNNSGRRLVFELPHDLCCTEDECLCNVVEQQSRDHNPQTGEVGTRSTQVRVARSMILPARAATEPLPEALLTSAVVADLVKRGLLLSEQDEEEQQRRAATTRTRVKSGFFTPPTSTPPAGNPSGS